jgi:putative endonuclease
VASPLSESRDDEVILRDQNIFMYYVYLLESEKNKNWYIGYSSDLRKRINNHLSGNGGQTTKRQNDWKLIYYEAYLNKKDAIGREKFLKSGSGRKFLKRQLINYLEKPIKET